MTAAGGAEGRQNSQQGRAAGLFRNPSGEMVVAGRRGLCRALPHMAMGKLQKNKLCEQFRDYRLSEKR